MRVRLSFLATAAAAAATAVLAAGLLTGCAPAGPAIDGLTAVDFRQSQAIPDFDDGEYTQDDPEQLERLVELLREHGIDPATWRGADSGCAGNRVTTATLHDGDSGLDTQLRIDSCNDNAFEQAADELFTEWREQLSR